MRWLLSLLLLLACGSHVTAASKSASPSLATTQGVREGLEVLCASRWNGQLFGNRFMQWIPDELHEQITNKEVTKLVIALTGPMSDRTIMFDAFVAENHIANFSTCPFRDRLASWPSELPVIPANKNERTPPL